MLRDLNFAAGLLMIFAVGMLLLATAALLAPYLQTLAGYSVSEAGLLIAPRGAGTMAGIMLAGRLTNRVDLRRMMFAGILMTAASLWQMTGWTPDVDVWSLSVTSIVQGFGLGLRLHAAAVVAFSTLAGRAAHRGHGALQPAPQCRLRDRDFADVGPADAGYPDRACADRRTGDRRSIERCRPAPPISMEHGDPQELAALNAEVTRQAAIVAYVDDFKLLFLVCLLAPLLLLMRRPDSGAAVDLGAAAH